MSELLPCPFCDGKPEFRRSGRNWHNVACTGCDASSALFSSEKGEVRPRLIAAWNRRTPSEPHQEYRNTNDA